MRPWTERPGNSMGATLTSEQGWRLAKAWYEDRLSPGWTRKRPEEARAVFEEVGLTGSFWDLG